MVHQNVIQLITNLAEKQKHQAISTFKVTGLKSELREDEFLAIDKMDGTFMLVPYPEFNSFIFRGQSSEYDKCLPTIYRNKSKLIHRILSLAKVEEFKSVLKCHPAVNACSQFNINGIKFNVDYEGLAQHYGLNTRYIDFTSNPVVAAFFASTSYDVESDRFMLFNGKNKEGVIYEMNIHAETLKNKPVHAIGLQPLPRPAEQYGFGVLCGKNGLFDKYKIKKNHFDHDAFSAKQIFEYMDGGLKLFPDDPLALVAKKINASNVISSESIYAACNELKTRKVELHKIIKMAKQSGINITVGNTKDLYRSDFLLSQEAWNKNQNDFFKRIKFRLVADHFETS